MLCAKVWKQGDDGTSEVVLDLGLVSLELWGDDTAVFMRRWVDCEGEDEEVYVEKSKVVFRCRYTELFDLTGWGCRVIVCENEGMGYKLVLEWGYEKEE